MTYAALAAFPLLLWLASRPLAGILVLATVAGLFVGARRASKLVRCLYDCGGFAIDPGGNVRICVTRTRVDDVCHSNGRTR